ncbi:DsbC family protein [Orrella sp. JC864]|uniref:DsbC family protein n=1 Tax=Orrella sp. JC864 TaxID=3120298 RepID=UPI0012BB99DD
MRARAGALALAWLLGLGGIAQAAQDAEADTEAVRKLFSERFNDVPVAAVRLTPYGLYEVQVGSDLVYTDAQVTFLLDGTLIDAETRRDLTRERREALLAVPFDELPLALAVKQVKGDGSRRLAIFEDPNCGYCKQMRHTLEDVDNVTLYTFLLPILTPDSHEKVRDVWCAGDPVRAWDDWMLRNKPPARATCEHPADQVIALAQKLMVRGTPTLFFADGTRAPGALTREALERRLK